jgi:hypothetical protein
MTAPVLIPATCELWIDGARYADGLTPADSADPFALSGLRIDWGRDTTVDQPQPATCVFSILDPPGGAERFDQTVALGSTVIVWAELGGTRLVVFAGRITDLAAEFDDDADAAVCQVVAADQLADLGNRFVGSEPWPVESLAARAERIMRAVGLDPAVSLPPIPAPVWNTQVSRVDVDRQAAAELLTELAVTGGAVLWSCFDSNTRVQVLVYEDPGARASLYVFALDPDRGLWAPTAGVGAGTPLSACQVLQDPVQWSRAVGDLITRTTVRWQDQTTSPDPTERSYGIVSTAAETAWGARGISLSTLLTSEAAAQNLAARTLAAHQPSPAWRTDGLTWDLAQTTADTEPTRALVRTLLDNRARLGLPIALTDLPYWTPTGAAVQLYIEGGSYTYSGGRWTLALVGAPATGLGGSLTYGATDRSVRYQDVAPEVAYLDLIGVGPAPAAGQQPADQPEEET